MSDVTCSELVELLTEWTEGALPLDRAEALADHLDSCAGCSAYVAQMRATTGILAQLGLEADALSAGTWRALAKTFHERAGHDA